MLTEDPGPGLDDVLWWTARAYRMTYEPPPAPHSDVRVMRVRGRRALATAREGSASVSWLADGTEKFELEEWPRKFQGIYLLLALHALGERAGLARLQTGIGRASGLLHGLFGADAGDDDASSKRAARARW